MQALALIALRDWDLAVANLAPIKVRENAVFRIDLADGRTGRAPGASQRLSFGRGARFGVRLDARAASGRHRGSARDSLAARPRFRSHCVSASGNARQIDVFEWIEGRQLGSVESGIGGDGAAIAEQYQMIGAIAARMHNHTADWRPPGGIPAPRLGRRGAGGGATVLGPVLGARGTHAGREETAHARPCRRLRPICRTTARSPIATGSYMPTSSRKICSSTAIAFK